MTSILESIIAILAPHHCIVCGIEDNVLCNQCQQHLGIQELLACPLCDLPFQQAGVCLACRRKLYLSHITVVGLNGGIIRQMIRDFKFHRLRAAAEPLAALLASRLPYMAPATMIVPIPTANNRIRQRGYDHTGLLAKALSRRTGFRMVELLGRQTQTRQVGARRQQRQRQAEVAYYVRNKAACVGATILLIDDVITTGATMRAAMRLLYEAGAESVAIAAIAKQEHE